jgi:hypothetical protein
MTDWTPKPSAPVAFNGVDALLSIIHGDPVWGWLEGWVHLYPSSYINTTDFCLAGPWNVGTLNLGDLLNAAQPNTNDYVEGVARTEIKIIGALHDRLFSAMCEQASVGGICEFIDIHTTHLLVPYTGDFSVIGTIAVRPGVSYIRIVADTATNAVALKVEPGISPAETLSPGGAYDHSYGPGAGNTSGLPALASIELLGAPFAAADLWIDLTVHQFADCEATPFDPAPQPQPDGYTPRVIPPTDTVADVGPLLANIEFKLEYVLNMVQGLSLATTPLPGGTTDVADLTPDVDVPVGDAVGAIFTASEIPASVSLDFGSPQNVIRLCHINFGNATGWYPSIWMTHTPFIVRPLPVGTTKLTTTAVIPGATISYQLIKREAPGL